jgi:hypothetical protein
MHDNTEYLKMLLSLQETGYKNTLALIGLIELLLEKKIITQNELSDKTAIIHEYAFDDQNQEKTTSAPAL